MTAMLGDGSGEVLPVGHGPGGSVCERLAKRIRRVAQRAQAKIAVEIYLMCRQPPQVDQIPGCTQDASLKRDDQTVGRDLFSDLRQAILHLRTDVGQDEPPAREPVTTLS